MLDNPEDSGPWALKSVHISLSRCLLSSCARTSAGLKSFTSEQNSKGASTAAVEVQSEYDTGHGAQGLLLCTVLTLPSPLVLLELYFSI